MRFVRGRVFRKDDPSVRRQRGVFSTRNGAPPTGVFVPAACDTKQTRLQENSVSKLGNVQLVSARWSASRG